MFNRRIIAFTTFAFLLLFIVGIDAYAGQKSRSGSYQGRQTSGTWQQNINRSPGHAERTTTWQNERGQGSRVSERNWSKESGTGSYSSTATRADGKTTSRQGTVTKTGPGAYTVDGTRTGANGKVMEVDKSITRNPDGSRAVHSVTTGPEGETRTVDSTVRKTEQGRSVTGTYSASGGKSGAFESNVNRTDNGVVKQQSVTNQDGQTWQRGIKRTREGGTVGREVTVTNPQGGTRTYNESVTVNPPAPAGN
jgi:hypothetical protein